MTAAVPSTEPLEVRAGLTWSWTKDLSDYPATSWTLKYWFKLLTTASSNFSITATASGAQHVISVAASVTAAYTAGDWSWAAIVSAGSEAYPIANGTMVLLPRYDQAASLDDRSHARKMLDLIEAAIEAFASKASVKSYTIGTRQMTRADLPELTGLRDYYLAEVRAELITERNARGMGGNRLVVRL